MRYYDCYKPRGNLVRQMSKFLSVLPTSLPWPGRALDLPGLVGFSCEYCTVGRKDCLLLSTRAHNGRNCQAAGAVGDGVQPGR
eukprot:scaffold649695_cov52-Prasinocladus_malaysianus.AAC.1